MRRVWSATIRGGDGHRPNLEAAVAVTLAATVVALAGCAAHRLKERREREDASRLARARELVHEGNNAALQLALAIVEDVHDRAGPSLVSTPLLPSIPPRRCSASAISTRARIASTLKTAPVALVPIGEPSASVHALGSLIESPSGARTTTGRSGAWCRAKRLGQTRSNSSRCCSTSRKSGDSRGSLGL